MWHRKDQRLEFKKYEKSDRGVLQRDAAVSETVILHHLLSSPLPYYRVLSLPSRLRITIACYLHHDVSIRLVTAAHSVDVTAVIFYFRCITVSTRNKFYCLLTLPLYITI
ncbi:hypothetical protein P8452_39169 [Trifolium repens]|nr:hypothetical protein P8452_39169 [Trifolium repens]